MPCQVSGAVAVYSWLVVCRSPIGYFGTTISELALTSLSARSACLFGLPARVGDWDADGAGPVAGGPRVIFAEKEDPVLNIATAGNGTQRGGAIEATVDAVTTVPAERPGLIARVGFAVGTDKCPDLAHWQYALFNQCASNAI